MLTQDVAFPTDDLATAGRLSADPLKVASPGPTRRVRLMSQGTGLAATSLLLAMLLAACSGSARPSAKGPEEPAAPQGLHGEPMFVTRIEGAIALDVTAGPEAPLVAWTTHDSVTAARLDLASGELVDPSTVSGDLVPVHHAIERPAVMAGPDGVIDVAFISATDRGGTVYLSRDGSVPEAISGPARPETNLVHAVLDPEGSAVLAWLEDSSLSVAFGDGSLPVEAESVDDRTCDCCNPVPVFSGDTMLVAYRDLDEIGGEIVRNVVSTRSDDGRLDFEDPVTIADDDWLIDGCPFTGPDVAVVGDTLVVAWMDARQSRYPEQDGSSIWVDRSTDDGATFGEDLEIISGGFHRWPTMAVDDEGIVHLIWETEGPEGGLSYAWSADSGSTFSEPVLLLGRQIRDGGALRSPTATFQAGAVVVSWADSRAGYVAAWPSGR